MSERSETPMELSSDLEDYLGVTSDDSVFIISLSNLHLFSLQLTFLRGVCGNLFFFSRHLTSARVTSGNCLYKCHIYDDIYSIILGLF